MRCRHTVADWRRHVADPSAAPIYAACRLLIRDDQPVAEPHAIACGYWGRQEACPLYEGPRAAARPAAASAAAEARVDPGSVWPVRQPGEPDAVALGLAGLHVAAGLLLLAAAIAALAGAGWIWLLLAAGPSALAHACGALRSWAGR
jgi:hypothetical protein